MKIIPQIIFISFLFVFPSQVHAESELPNAPGVHNIGSSGKAAGRENQFSVSVPKVLNLDKKRPLLVVLHGANNNGSNYIRDWAVEAGVTDMIILSPNARAETGHWSAEDSNRVLGLVQRVSVHYNVDRSKIFAAGFSSGGWMVFELALKHPRLFRAAVIICGYASEDALAATRRSPYKVPLYVFAGKQDRAISIDLVRKQIGELKRNRYDVTFEQLEMGHASPTEILVLSLNWFDTFQS